MNYFKFGLSLLAILFCLCIFSPAFAQNIPANISNINVDELSDAQVKQLMMQAQANGLSDQQMIQEAQNRGMSADQVQRLQRRVNDIRQREGGASKKQQDTSYNNQSGRKLNYQTDTDSLSGKVPQNLFDALKPKIFGADLFKNNNIRFEPNLKLATPVNYIVGPENKLNINVYGNVLVNWKLDV